MATRHRHRKLRKSGKSSRKHQRTFRRKNRVKRNSKRSRRRVMMGGMRGQHAAVRLMGMKDREKDEGIEQIKEIFPDIRDNVADDLYVKLMSAKFHGTILFKNTQSVFYMASNDIETFKSEVVNWLVTNYSIHPDSDQIREISIFIAKILNYTTMKQLLEE